ncbi:MAG: HAD-IC family P-type ATPase [Candidatus Nomurabacteria bacterium]|jgi:cation-transporting ATPase E|nr:HAD-IC family P-type ATPase [Candidatus Nomurabacteria bacterium]
MNEKIPAGLTQGEVQALTLEGKVNFYDVKSEKTVWRIIADNIFNIFWLLNALIATALILVGSYTNALFMVFVMVGTASGIVVELRARNIVEKLTLLNKNKVKVVRDSNEEHIDPDTVVLGDILKLVAGDQIPADSTILQGSIEVNEALLTGEPDLIVKKRGGELLSGSYVTSGQCYAEVKHVGADNYVTKLTIEAKTHKPIHSEILGSINVISRFTSRVILPLGLILLLEALLMRQDGLKNSVVSTAAALIGMLPKGLAILTIIALITAVFKLGRKKVLVQEIYSVETMAHIDMICLDKTGTLTDGKLRVRDFEMLDSSYPKKYITEIMGSYLGNTTDNNSTNEALKTFFEINKNYNSDKSIPFSSDRKWGAVHLDGVGMIVLGAPERIFEQVPEEIIKQQKKGLRVLGLGISDKHDITSKKDLTGVRPLAMINLEDSIRKGAKETLDYLREQGVETRVISGDNPMTVSKIAERAGFENYKKYLDVSGLNDDELRAVVPDTAIFGRVSPYQKRVIVRELKALGKTVAMTGDGVNDILALRESDLSIVMAEGDSATKQIGNIVLLESNFTELPDVLFEGRRVVNNMFRVSSIFFIKTMYSFFVATLCALSAITGHPVVFPFIAIQITVIDQVLEGYPTFFISFEGDKRPIIKTFLKSSLLKALPQSIMVTLSLVAIYIWTTVQGWGNMETTTLMYYTLGTITLIGVFKACLPFSKLRAFLFTTSMIGFYLSAYILGRWFTDFVKLDVISGRAIIFLVIIAAICVSAAIILQKVISRRQSKKLVAV